MTEEMIKLRMMLDDEGIEWHDASSLDAYPMWRTHFKHRDYHWSVIHGYGSFGGFNFLERTDKGLLEVMSEAINDGEPIGWLTAEEVMQYVRGDEHETNRRRRASEVDERNAMEHLQDGRSKGEDKVYSIRRT